MKKVILAALFVLAAPFASASVFTQSNASTDSGATYSFDVSSFSFAPEYVDTITVANAGQGIAHNHGSPSAQGTLEIYDGTSWVIVDQFAIGADYNYDTFLGNIFSMPVTFAGQLISGLRLSETEYVGFMYHDIAPNMTFTTSAAAAVPEPASIALLGLGLLGYAASRRKSAK